MVTYVGKKKNGIPEMAGYSAAKPRNLTLYSLEVEPTYQHTEF